MITVLFWIALGSLLVVIPTAIGARVLNEFSRHELQVYCRQRNKPEVFDQVLDSNDQFALGAEAIQWFANACLVVATCLWLFARPSTYGNGGEVTGFQFPSGSELILYVIVLAFGLVLINSWIPWAIAKLASAPFLFHTWSIWRIVSQLAWPFSIGYAVLTFVAHRIAGREEDDDDDEEALEEEIRTIVTAGERGGLLESDAREMIEGVIDLDDVDVGEIMTPRSRMNALDIELPPPELIRKAIEFGHTRIPIFRRELNNIVGLLFVKDLLPLVLDESGPKYADIHKHLRPPQFVPLSIRSDELLQRFRASRSHLSIVVDEYESVVGVVTIEDVLEEIVGDITDETDSEEEPVYREIDKSRTEVLATVHIDNINDHLKIHLPVSDDFDTLAGLMLTRLGRVPHIGESIVEGNVRLRVTEATRRRVFKVEVQIVEDEPVEGSVE